MAAGDETYQNKEYKGEQIKINNDPTKQTKKDGCC